MHTHACSISLPLTHFCSFVSKVLYKLGYLWIISFFWVNKKNPNITLCSKWVFFKPFLKEIVTKCWASQEYIFLTRILFFFVLNHCKTTQTDNWFKMPIRLWCLIPGQNTFCQNTKQVKNKSTYIKNSWSSVRTQQHYREQTKLSTTKFNRLNYIQNTAHIYSNYTLKSSDKRRWMNK